MSDRSLAVAVRAARNAAAVIEDAARDLVRLPLSSTKHGRIAGAAAAEAANAIATTLATAFPDPARPAADTRGEAEPPPRRRWMVDALDGRDNFRHGYPHYAISIALAEGTELTHAVVLDPVHDELFTAIKGRGAVLNGVALRVSACTALEQALVGTSIPAHADERLGGYLPIFNALLARGVGIRRAGACALDLAYVAAGRLDAFWVISLRADDLAAGALLVREAGGRVGDFAGAADCLASTELIAATPGVFNALREAIDTALV